jgi:hypothetical protein
MHVNGHLSRGVPQPAALSDVQNVAGTLVQEKGAELTQASAQFAILPLGSDGG